MTSIFQNWHAMRLLRAGIAIWAFTEAFRTGEWILMAPGSIFALQAIFDVGCCGAAGCAAPPVKTSEQALATEVVEYEEVR